jgi:hypothetical protein
MTNQLAVTPTLSLQEAASTASEFARASKSAATRRAY